MEEGGGTTATLSLGTNLSILVYPRPTVGTRFSKACAFWVACDACSAVFAGSGTPVKKLGENFPKLPNDPGELFVASAFGTGENGGKVLRIGGYPGLQLVGNRQGRGVGVPLHSPSAAWKTKENLQLSCWKMTGQVYCL